MVISLKAFLKLMIPMFSLNEVRGTAENHREIEQGKTTTNDGLPPLMPPRSILQKQAKTKVLPVLPTTTPLKVISQYGNAEAEHSVTIHLSSLQ